MQKIHLSTFINAPRQKVWSVMLADATYRQWTSAFGPTSHFEGSWEQGSEIRFLADGKEGETGGMFSRIEVSRPYEFLSIEHLGVVKNGIVDRDSDEVKKWVGAHENYTFNEKDGGTELVVDMDIGEEEKEYMETAWKHALVLLKGLVEELSEK